MVPYQKLLEAAVDEIVEVVDRLVKEYGDQDVINSTAHIFVMKAAMVHVACGMYSVTADDPEERLEMLQLLFKNSIVEALRIASATFETETVH